MTNDRESSWENRLKNQVFRGWHNYERHRLTLDSARIAEVWTMPGEFIYVEQVSSESALAGIRLNLNTNDALDLQAGTVIKTVFKEFYISHTAQAGEWIDLIVGINFEYYKRQGGRSGGIEQARAVVKLTHAAADTNVVPAAQICNRVCIKADVNNTSTAWINFGTAAVQNACFPLEPSESLSVSISNLDRINANFEVGGECVFIVYEV